MLLRFTKLFKLLYVFVLILSFFTLLPKRVHALFNINGYVRYIRADGTLIPLGNVAVMHSNADKINNDPALGRVCRACGSNDDNNKKRDEEPKEPREGRDNVLGIVLGEDEQLPCCSGYSESTTTDIHDGSFKLTGQCAKGGNALSIVLPESLPPGIPANGKFYINFPANSYRGDKNKTEVFDNSNSKTTGLALNDSLLGNAGSYGPHHFFYYTDYKGPFPPNLPASTPGSPNNSRNVFLSPTIIDFMGIKLGRF